MRVTCVVDDAVHRSSSFWGEHGLAFLIETGGRRLLFDTGQSETILMHNLELLRLDLETIDALAISHAHYDHSGGLPALLQRIRPGTPLYANPDLFRERFSKREGKSQSAGLSRTRAELEERLELKLSAAPQEIFPGVWTTGEITERPEPEGSSGYHLMRVGEDLVADIYRDDMALVVEARDRLMLVCGCCHAGLLNTVAHVEQIFRRPIAVIVGGLHLAHTGDEDLQHITERLAEMPELECVYPNHCTGEKAYVALTEKLGPSVVRPCPAGSHFEWEAAS